ncbi:MAG: hypothetical protein LBM60_07760 [Clostridium sp.]|jgi:hypothetical protein|nr:hypothetical protein [Clostridium sp.]
MITAIQLEVIEALKQLEYDDPKPVVIAVSVNRYEVTLRGEYIGLWDSARKTFVD